VVVVVAPAVGVSAGVEVAAAVAGSGVASTNLPFRITPTP
jgi:hypothetical protein